MTLLSFGTLSLVALLQSQPTPATPPAGDPPPAAAAPATDAGKPGKPWMEILDAAIATQHGEPFASDLQDFQAKLIVHTRDEKQGDLEFDVERAWKSPNLIWTLVKEVVTKKSYEQGYDGGDQYWLKDKDGTKLLEGPDYKADRALIKQDLELMNLMMRFCFLKNALAEMKNVETLASVTLMRPDPQDPSTDVKTECDVIRAQMALADAIGGSSTVTLHIEHVTHFLAQVRIEPQDTKKIATELHFSAHVKNAQGVVVPQNIDVFRGAEKDPWQRLSLLGLDEAAPNGDVINNIRFNTGLDISRFQPPKKK